MITQRPDNWREIRDEEGLTYVSAEKFKELISKEGYFFVHETYPYPNRFIRVKEENKKLVRYKLLSTRTHNIDVDEVNHTIMYEGNDSSWHEIYGPKGSYEMLLDILNRKTQEV